MTVTFELDPAAQRLAQEMREWSVAHVRPLARHSDTLHATPPGAEDALAVCPIDVSPIVYADIHAKPTTDLVASHAGSGSHLLAFMLMEQMAYGDLWPLNAMKGSGFTHKIVPMLGTPQQNDKWVGGIDRGDFASSAFALTEPQFGSDTSQLATTAERTERGWRINGSKMYCSNGANADFIILIARIKDDPRSVRAFMVERQLEGVQVIRSNEAKLGLRSTQTSAIRFENVEVPVDACLGFTADGQDHGIANGLRGALGTLTSSRPYMSALAVGIGQASIDSAEAWLDERHNEFTPREHARRKNAIAEMSRRLHGVRLLTYKLGWLRDQGRDTRVEGSMVKAYGAPLGERACRLAVDVMGPEGCSENHLVEKWYRDVKIFDIFEGTGQIQRLTIGREIFR